MSPKYATVSNSLRFLPFIGIKVWCHGVERSEELSHSPLLYKTSDRHINVGALDGNKKKLTGALCFLNNQ